MDRRFIEVSAYIVLLFLISQALGLYAGAFIIRDASENEVVSQFFIIQSQAISGSGQDQNFSALVMFASVMAGAGVMYLLVRFYSGRLLFMLVEFGAVSVASSIVFYSLTKPFLPDTALSMAVSIICGLIFAGLKLVFPQLKNAAAILATAGAGAAIGFQISFETSLILLVLLSVYDYIAVFKTKHMVALATSASKQEMPFMVSSRKKTEKGEIKVELGTGDMVMPIVLGVSGMQIGPLHAGIVFIASLLSVISLLFLLGQKKQIIPALPIIAVFNLVFLGIAKLAGII